MKKKNRRYNNNTPKYEHQCRNFTKSYVREDYSKNREIKNKKEIFDPQYKIYRDKTLINVHIKIQLLLDKKLKSKNLIFICSIFL